MKPAGAVYNEDGGKLEKQLAYTRRASPYLYKGRRRQRIITKPQLWDRLGAGQEEPKMGTSLPYMVKPSSIDTAGVCSANRLNMDQTYTY